MEDLLEGRTNPLASEMSHTLEADKNVTVFEYALTTAKKGILKNVFLHELGQCLWPSTRIFYTAKKEGDGAKQSMKTNLDSVMDDNPVPMMQKTDQEEIREFYKLKNRADVDGSPVYRLCTAASEDRSKCFLSRSNSR